MIELNNLIQAIRKRRKFLKLTQKDLADQLGWSRDKVTRIETMTSQITIGEAYAIAEVLNMSIAKALRPNAERKPNKNFNTNCTDSSYGYAIRYQ